MSPERADQVACTERVLAVTPDAAIVSNLGVASYALAAVEDRPRNFYQWGSMGSTTPVGLGLSLAIDDPVTVLDGDGSTLMSLGALATVAEYGPATLTVVVFDNGEYLTTGGQPTLSESVDFAGVARECGLHAAAASSVDGFEDAYVEAVAYDGPSLVACAVEPAEPDGRPPLDYAHVKRRFRDALADE